LKGKLTIIAIEHDMEFLFSPVRAACRTLPLGPSGSPKCGRPADEVIEQLNKFKEDAKSPHLDRYIALT